MDRVSIKDHIDESKRKYIDELGKKLIDEFSQQTFLKKIANKNYSGEIKGYGSKVKIKTISQVSLHKYQKHEYPNARISVNPTNVVLNLELEINRGYYWDVLLKDVYEMQSDEQLMNMWLSDAARQLKIEIEKEFLEFLASGSTKIGTTDAPVDVNADNIIETITSVGTVLDNNNVPSEGRWIILPPSVCTLIKLLAIKGSIFVKDYNPLDSNGLVCMIDNFQIYNSNQLKITRNGSDLNHHCIAGHNTGVTFAHQYKNTDVIRSSNNFDDVVIGFGFYDFKVTKPETVFDIVMREKL